MKNVHGISIYKDFYRSSSGKDFEVLNPEPDRNGKIEVKELVHIDLWLWPGKVYRIDPNTLVLRHDFD